MTYSKSQTAAPLHFRLGSRLLLLAVMTIGTASAGFGADVEEPDTLDLQTVMDLRSVILCVEAYRIDNDVFPGPTDGFVTADFLLPYLEPVYIRSLPLDDAWGTPFTYWSDGTRFVLVSHGPDGLPDRDYVGVGNYADGGDDFVVVDGIAEAVPLHLRQMVRSGQQKATMADMRSIATAIEAFKIDNGRCPGPTSGPVEVGWVRAQLQPIYIRMLPLEDDWGTPFVYWSDGEHYRIASLGEDRTQDGPFEEIEPGTATQTFASDIVFEDGAFIQYPEGEQH